MLKTKFEAFCLFLITSFFGQATGTNKEFIIDDSIIILVLAWIVGIIIIALLLSRRKYKKTGLSLAQENIDLGEKIKKLEKELKDEKEKVLEIEKMDLLEAIKKTNELNKKILKSELQKEKMDKALLETTYELNERKAMLEAVNDELNMESFALYKPKYDFANSSQYKFKLEEIRKKQKEMVKSKKAVHYSKDWTINGSASEGRKMTNNNIKMILRSFNSDCEAAINKIKFSNLERIGSRIYKFDDSLATLLRRFKL